MVDKDLVAGVGHVLRTILACRAGDDLLLLADTGVDPEIVRALTGAGRKIGASVVTMRLDLPSEPGYEVPRSVAAAMTGASAIVVVTAFHPSFFRTAGVWRAVYEFAVPLLHIDPPHELSLLRSEELINPERMTAISSALADELRGAKTVRVIQGDAELVARFDPGTIHYSNEFPLRQGLAVCPPGVCVFMPDHNSVQGTAVFEALDGFAGPAIEPIRMEVRAGKIESVAGGAEAEALRKVFDSVEGSGVLSEMGIGLNPAIAFGDVVSSPWHESVNRAAGVFHAGIGSTFWRRSAVPYHAHVASHRATLVAEPGGRVIVDQGRLTVLDAM